MKFKTMELITGYNEGYLAIGDYKMFLKCIFNPNSEEAVLLLHGLGCTSGTFEDIINSNYLRGKTILIPDLIGFGKSSKPVNFSYSMQEQAEILDEMLTHLPSFKLHIAAHSMSGSIALLLSKKTFNRVISFSNIEGNLIGEDCGLLSRRIIKNSFQDYNEKVFEKHTAMFANDAQLRFGESTSLAIYESAKSLVEISDTGELLERFVKLPIKKCYIFGERNIEMPVLKKLEKIKKIMISNSGHAMMTDNPREFYTKLDEFISC